MGIAIAIMYFILYYMLTRNMDLNEALATYNPTKNKYSGLIIGPLLISLFLMMVRVYTKEYGGVDAKKEVNL